MKNLRNLECKIAPRKLVNKKNVLLRLLSSANGRQPFPSVFSGPRTSFDDFHPRFHLLAPQPTKFSLFYTEINKSKDKSSFFIILLDKHVNLSFAFINKPTRNIFKRKSCLGPLGQWWDGFQRARPHILLANWT